MNLPADTIILKAKSIKAKDLITKAFNVSNSEFMRKVKQNAFKVYRVGKQEHLEDGERIEQDTEINYNDIVSFGRKFIKNNILIWEKQNT